MSPIKQSSFTHVKDILRKIDRSIDDARARRLSAGPGHPAARPHPAVGAANSQFHARPH